MGPKLVSETEDNVRLIRDCLKAASDRQKLYSDLKRRDIVFSVGNQVFLRYLRERKIFGLDIKLELPSNFDRIHDVFHVSMLRRYRSDPSHIVFVKEIEVKPNLTFEEEPIQTLD
ncbi:uncharacterized protein LOC128041685 [Gossypium raimondii]|uniref:uncharacterized protein LOC128041685 n=1 Tax=Gossypium raimondii TaxID=29730 RepID=UPI00227A6147|nr:uncharacterized protein LOC128041685 [Gossypium raimondii]